VSSAEETEGTSDAPTEQEGVLSNLPRTRPQRSSPRRAAARASGAAPAASANGRPTGDAEAPGASAGSGAKGRTTAGTKRPAAKRTTTAKAKKSGAAKRSSRAGATSRPRARAQAEAEVPRQGFESEGDRLTGPVPPPGATELLATAAEAANELAKAGISAGERLARDVLSRLSRS
jgi:hypothetical protein